MHQAMQKKNIGVRILLGVMVGMLGVGMLLYLVPGQGGSGVSQADVVADVGGQPVTLAEVRRQMSRLQSRGSIPPALEPLYARQIVNQLVYERMLELEAQRLGIRVTEQERADRIRQLIPTAFVGDTFVGMERYTADVQSRFQMGVQEFEALVQQGLLQEKIEGLVTDGISVTPREVQQEFRRQNEKIKIEYVLIQPDNLEAKVPVTDADLETYFAKNKARYVVPERRVIRYALLDLDQLRRQAPVSDAELQKYYDQHIDRYRIPDRVHARHILFKTIGMTDAEIQEVKKKAEDVLKQAKAKHGADFEELAKKYSEDTTREKGGDLGWIVRGQTVPAFENAAFGLPKGAISNLVQTQYGFHIIQVVDRETAHTQSLAEVKDSILPTLIEEKVQRLADEQTAQIAEEIRRSSRQSLDALAKQFNLTLGETPAISAADPILGMGKSQELEETAFRQQPGQVSLPIRVDRGYVVISVKEIRPTHPATLAEVRDAVDKDYRREKAVELAKERAAGLAKQTQGGQSLAAAAKAFGLEAKTSDAFARSGSVPAVGSARQLAGAFALKPGETGAPVFLGANWVVYRVLEHQEPNLEEAAKLEKTLEQQVLQSKRQIAYEMFRSALETRLTKEGKLKFNADVLKQVTRSL